MTWKVVFLVSDSSTTWIKCAWLKNVFPFHSVKPCLGNLNNVGQIAPARRYVHHPDTKGRLYKDRAGAPARFWVRSLAAAAYLMSAEAVPSCCWSRATGQSEALLGESAGTIPC